jgi:hypothetical protein
MSWNRLPPTMPLTANIWRSDAVWGTPAPDVTCRAALYPRYCDPTTGYVIFKLLVPAGTDVRDVHCQSPPAGAGADVVECPAGSGCFFDVCEVGDMWKGWPGVYRMATLKKRAHPGTGNLWPAPIP